MEDQIVSIVGSSYFGPISLLLEELDKQKPSNSNEIQSGYYENGYSSSICILSVICLESYVMRVKYINRASQKDIDHSSVQKYLTQVYSDFPFKKELNEIHIVRDILAHNHLWEVSYTNEDGNGMKHDESIIRSTGDKKYKEYVNKETNLTCKLGLNTSPIRVGASDARLVLQTVWRVLLFLESKDRNQCYVSHLQVKHKGKMMKFGDVIGLSTTST
jgi:hypothetical protein